MSITRAMYAGVSGLAAEGGALGVVGDNVANTNTVGFKQSRAIFSDVLGAAVGSNQPGSGVRMTRAQQIFAQGSLTSTGQAMDVALSGDGFFVVAGEVEGVKGTFFTRAGQLNLRADGAVVNADGLEVQGYPSDGQGGFLATTSGIKLPAAPIPPKASSNIKIGANLDAAATPPAAFDPNNPSTTSNLATSITTYDSLGNAHPMDVYFAKSATGSWSYHVMAKGDEITGGPAGASVEVASGTLTFDANGALQAQTDAGGTVAWKGATPAALKFDFGKPVSAGGTGTDGLTQYGSPSTIAAQTQDGYASGSLAGVRIGEDGIVSGVYSNGQTIAAGSLAIAKFRANDGLDRAGRGLWVATRESGEAAIGTAGSGGRAALVAGALEQSNVDVTQQFVELITHQRAFQANSKTITTADQMLQEVLALKQ